MYASVKMPLHSAANVLTVPIRAIRATGAGKGVVLVVDQNNKIENREVVLGMQSATEVEITSGLRENETVVFGAQAQYKAGKVVSPKLVVPSMTE